MTEAPSLGLPAPNRRLLRNPAISASTIWTESHSRTSRRQCCCAETRRRRSLSCPKSRFRPWLLRLPTGPCEITRLQDQIGRNDSLDSYIESIVSAFEEVRRVLRTDGTAWLNVGDSYTSGNRKYRAPDRKNRARAMRVRPPTPEGLKPKDLIGVPWRLAFALQDTGWWIRSEIVWHKPNVHPESVRDRPTKAHETIFLLSRGKGLLLRQHCCPRAAGSPSEDGLGTAYGAGKESDKLGRRSPCDDAHVTCTAMPQAHEPRR